MTCWRTFCTLKLKSMARNTAQKLSGFNKMEPRPILPVVHAKFCKSSFLVAWSFCGEIFHGIRQSWGVQSLTSNPWISKNMLGRMTENFFETINMCIARQPAVGRYHVKKTKKKLVLYVILDYTNLLPPPCIHFAYVKGIVFQYFYLSVRGVCSVSG